MRVLHRKRKVIKRAVPKMHGLPTKNTFHIEFQEYLPKNQTAKPSKVKKVSHFYNTLEEFTSTTTLHGFQYILNKKYSRIERLWWLVMVFCSFMVSTFYIREIWLQWNTEPVVLTISDISASVWEIPFPAVTICSETQSRQSVFNFTKAFDERWSDPSPISAKDLKIYHDMLLVCNNSRSDGPDFADISSIETLRRLAPRLDETFYRCKWGNYTCNELFFRTMTKYGQCFTFNMFSAGELFRLENLHNDYTHTNADTKSDWSLETGYASNATVFTYPYRGLFDSLHIILLMDIRDMDQRCRGPAQDFKIWLHNPAELPIMSRDFFRLSLNYQTHVTIRPKLIKASKRLRHYHPFQRSCYFADERYLKYFRTYTKQNCDVECAANYTAKRCDCVPLYLPHDPNTKVCGGGKSQCILKALEELFLANSQLEHINKNMSCGCLKSCTQLKYVADVSQAIYDTASLGISLDGDNTLEWRVPSGFTIYFEEEKYMELQRSELYGIEEFLANCGGIMGLFIGFSIFSLIEIVFYFTLRLWCRMCKQ